MSDVVEEPTIGPSRSALAGIMSIAAGAVQLFTAGTLGGHRRAVMTITLFTAAQLGWGIWALLRDRRDGALLGAVLHLGVVSFWLGAATSGLSFIGGLESRRPVDAALIATVVLSGVAGFAAVARLVDGRPVAEQHAPGYRATWGTAMVAGLAVVVATVASTTAPVSRPAPAVQPPPTNPGGLIGLPTGGGDIDEELAALISATQTTTTTTSVPAAPATAP